MTTPIGTLEVLERGERSVRMRRATRETTVEVALNLDGSGRAQVSTGIGFYDHLLTSFAHHGLFDLELAVNELAANAIVHGGGRGVLRVWSDDGHVVCEVADSGRITDPLAGRRPVAPSSYGGRGLLLVNRIADLVRVHHRHDGTAVVC